MKLGKRKLSECRGIGIKEKKRRLKVRNAEVRDVLLMEKWRSYGNKRRSRPIKHQNNGTSERKRIKKEKDINEEMCQLCGNRVNEIR